ASLAGSLCVGLGAMKRVVPLLLVPLLRGCVVFPDFHYHTVVPEIQGTLARSGVPLSDTRVFYRRSLLVDGCVDSKDQAHTDLAGKFVIPRRQTYSLVHFLGDPGNDWGICIVTPEATILGWRGRGIGIPPESARFECELTMPEAESGNGK